MCVDLVLALEPAMGTYDEIPSWQTSDPFNQADRRLAGASVYGEQAKRQGSYPGPPCRQAETLDQAVVAVHRVAAPSCKEEDAEDHRAEQAGAKGEQVRPAPVGVAPKPPRHREDGELERDRAEEVGPAVGDVLPGDIPRELASAAAGVDRRAAVGGEREPGEDLGEAGEGDQRRAEPSAQAAGRVECEGEGRGDEGGAPDRDRSVEDPWASGGACAKLTDGVVDLAVPGLDQPRQEDDREPGKLSGDRGKRQAADQLAAVPAAQYLSALSRIRQRIGRQA